MGPGWRLEGDRLFRLVQNFTQRIFKEYRCFSLGAIEFGNLTKGNVLIVNLKMALKHRCFMTF